ncbi:WD40 repeat protein [Nonlabens dokdonensis]|uniref:Outer membrane protein, peptidoglycan-associated lipoprotein n=2 Tax=Nonlabens dokdonensis TaxID=328515 RepID=L7WDE1_NONDD|nr:OmpA family protein [Nonlabens dokdonensis]AGC78267.1 outer membrane protein, peptidoglycan-associated lipoprotein [Nonlabens dokdonensis DSW-6]PZX37846.1 WD40 repeat protein [Nonlabens dokdonensis]
MRLSYTLLVTVILLSTSLNAQKLSLKKTNKLFENQAYKEAILNYENLEPSEEVLQNLADSYYFTNDLEKAAQTYERLIVEHRDIVDRQRVYRYAQSLLAVKNYKRADEYLSYYYGLYWNTEEFIKELEKTTPHVFEIKTVANKGSNSDFGLSFINDNNIAFASSRNLERPVYSWNGLPYLDLYEGELSDKNTISKVRAFSDEINTPLHESNAVFTNNGTVMYFNRNNDKRIKIDGVKISPVQLLRAEKVDGTWTNVTTLPFNSEQYSIQHPTISKNGKVLYFSSDMPGGYGDFDLYKVIINNDGTYSDPVNLGPGINTEHLEQFPYISDINTLYYATNGKQGLGGLDIHRVDMINGQLGTPINLGPSINSSRDDFSFVINEENNAIYFSSNRDGMDRIYSASREENILTKYEVSGVVQDSITKKILPGSLVSLLDERGILIDDMIVGKDATYTFKTDPNKKYTVRGTRKLYIPQDVDFSTDKNGKITHNIYLTLLSYEDAEEMIKPDRKGDVQVELDKIFFDFDESVIKPQAAATLNNLVSIMKKYPDMYIEVSAHTDVRGPSEYNLKLSNDRAASTMEYLISQGIEKRRLRSIGYGEMQPLNKCTEEGMCTDEEYELNRRCEFKIIQ